MTVSTPSGVEAPTVFAGRLRLKTARWVMTGDRALEQDALSAYFLDPNGQNRTITLPPLRDGYVIILSHIGIANTIAVDAFEGGQFTILDNNETVLLVSSEQEWTSILELVSGGGVVDNAYSVITDGTTPAQAVGEDTFRVRASDGVDIATQSNDATFGDNFLVQLSEQAALSVLGVAGNVTARPTAIAAAVDGAVLRRSGTSIGWALLDLTANVTGVLPIANGGTGQATATEGFDALAPSTAKGDLIAHNGSDNVRLAVGTDGFVLGALNSEATGLIWVAANAHLHTSTDISDFGEAAEDVVGLMATDSASINFTYDDVFGTLTAAVLPAGVDHDSLSGFVADEHIAHSGVTLTAGSGLTGGGTIATSRTFNVGVGDGISVAADTVAVNQAFSFVWTATHQWTITDAGTSNQIYPVVIRRESTGTPAAGFGAGIQLSLENAGGGVETASRDFVFWANVGAGVEDATRRIQLFRNGALSNVVEFQGNDRSLRLYGNDIFLGLSGATGDTRLNFFDATSAVHRTIFWDDSANGFFFEDDSSVNHKFIADDVVETISANWVFSGNPRFSSFIDFNEITAPANPGANIARMYSRDDAGTTKMYFRDSAGTETEMGGGGGGGGWTQLATSTPGAVTQVDFSSLADHDEYLVVVDGISCATNVRQLEMRISGDNGTGFHTVSGIRIDTTPDEESNRDNVPIGGSISPAAELMYGKARIYKYGSNIMVESWGAKNETSASDDSDSEAFNGVMSGSTLNFLRFQWSGTGNFDAGTITVYGRSVLP